MIISAEDLTVVHRLLEEVAASRQREDFVGPNPQTPVVLGERPHLLMSLGYNEYKTFETGALDDLPVISFHSREFANLHGLARFHAVYDVESIYRDRKSGAWYWYEGIGENTLHFVGPTVDPDRHVPIESWLASLESMHRQPDSVGRVLWAPGVWTPKIQEQQRISLSSTAKALIMAIHSQQKELRAIHWRELEEVVAELLRSKGLQILVTPRSADGGRDIIARGEIIPGEPTLLAVEVKQKPVVGLEDVQRVLRANEDFPVLMMATAGRFSAGVIAERDRCRNQMRLFLKDGIALSQWIEAYMSNRSRPNREAKVKRRTFAR